MSQIPVVDSHLHMWDLNHIPVKWLNSVPALNKSHLPTTLSEELKIPSKITNSFVPPNIEAIVYVEADVPAAYSLLEAEWVAHLARSDKRIQGLVANAPVEDGEGVRVYLDALVKIGKNDDGTLLKGVRRIIQHESPEFCLEPSFIAGVKLLSQYNLSFDICCKPQHLENVIELVADCPDTQFVLDHMGKPTISENDAGFEKWSDNISKLAKLPNIYCKLSGIVTEAETATGGKWKPEVLLKYVAHVLQAFGSHRVMFGSDWPVVKLGQVGYVDWLDIATTATATLTKEEKEEVWGGNATRFYRL